ncbi:hypothetical protein, partial [Salmonella sp. s51228]|uniref:hypothetical protein n=1 Tax=Salmonella sp. s51228 TaxID=3159652 RepID=UPI0039817C46
MADKKGMFKLVNVKLRNLSHLLDVGPGTNGVLVNGPIVVIVLAIEEDVQEMFFCCEDGNSANRLLEADC